MKWRKRSRKSSFRQPPDGMLSLKSGRWTAQAGGQRCGAGGGEFRSPDAYVEFLKGTISTDLTGLKVVVDCGHGAAYQVSPRVLELGAEVISLAMSPTAPGSMLGRVLPIPR